MTYFVLYLIYAFVQAIVLTRRDVDDFVSREQIVSQVLIYMVGAPLISLFVLWYWISEAIIWLVSPSWFKKK